ncbi:MAG: heme lyase NrfEFG subunit NrfE, partial [Paracoccaceae bacterium]
MTAEIGHYGMILALMIALAQAMVPLYGAWRRSERLMAFADTTAMAGLGFTSLAFAALLVVFGQTDLSVQTVASNANATMPLHFRLSAAWGNHEGSLLLWILILQLFGA